MNNLDVVILVVLGVGAIYGLSRGVLRMVTSIFSLVLALYFSLLYYAEPAHFIEHQLSVNPTLAAALGYVVVFAAVFIIIEVAGNIAAGLIRTIHLGWLDALAGAAVGAGVASALMGLVLMLLTALLPSQALLLRDSELSPRVLYFTEMLLSYVPPEIKQAYETHRAELARYWLEQEAHAAAARAASPTPTATK